MPPSVFFAFRAAPERRPALRRADSLDGSRLFGLDDIARRGTVVSHNLGRDGRPPPWARATGRTINAGLDAAGGLGGDFASILASRPEANAADVVLSTVDTVGIPLLLLKRARLIRPPLVYASIGLPERLARPRNERMRRLYRDALRSAETIVAYAPGEADHLRAWIGVDAPPVVFVPFGVDLAAFFPERDRPPRDDVVSVGADPRRDFELLAAVAARRPELRFRVVAAGGRAPPPPRPPPPAPGA